MSTLTGKKLDEVYHSLLKVDGNTDLSSTLQYIVDAQGNSSGIQVSTAGDMVATGDVTAAGFTGDLTGNADTATRWLNARTITIGDTGKSVDGTANVTWSKAEIGYDLQDVTDNGNSTSNSIILGGLTVDTDTLYVDATNNRVGIGTITPSAKVHIDSSSGDADLILEGLSGGNIQTIRIDQNSIRSTTNSQISIFTNNNSANGIYISSAGLIGVGTTSPARKLETVSSEQVVSLFRSLSSTSARITLMDANTTNDSKVGIASSGDNFLVYANGERMRITSAGDVGIGETSPAAKLDVNGSIASKGGSFSASVDSVTDAGVVVKQGNKIYSLANADQYLRNLIEHNSSNNIVIGQLSTNLIADIELQTGSSGNVRFYTNGSETVRINSSGNLGIGTQNPASGAKLTVMGNQTFGLPGNGSNTSGRFISIEGNTDGSGEGSSRIFFTEHNSTSGAMDAYGMSIGYRGGSTTITGASGNSWTGLSQISNGQWGMWGHNNDATGALIMYGDRAATFVNFAGNDVNGIDDLTVGNRLYVGTGGGYFYSDSGSRIRTNQDFYTNNSNTYLYANNLYLGNSSGDNVQVRGNRMYGNNWSIETDGAMIFQGSYVTNQDKIRNIDEDNYFRINDDTTKEELVEQWGGLSGGSISNITKVDDNTAPAVGCFELTGPVYSDSQGDYIKVDQNSDYTWEMWIKYVSGSDTDSRLYLGWSMYNSNKGYFGNSQRYWGQVGTQFDANSNNDGWYKITGTISGVGSGYGKFISGTEYVKPVLLLNYNGGSNKIRVCGFKLYRSQKRATELILTRKDYLTHKSESTENALSSSGYARIANDGADDVVINGNKVFREFGTIESTAYNYLFNAELPNYSNGHAFIHTGTTGANAITFRNTNYGGPGNVVGFIRINSTNTTYSTTSDYRAKENVVSLIDGIDRLKLLKPSRFNFIGHTEVVDGFIAHEAQEVVPQAVTGEKDAVGFDGEPIMQGIDHSKLVPLLTAALQEAVAKIEALEERITILENN